MQSRYYDAGVQRFISPDEPVLVGATGGIYSYNLYLYCENDPVNNSDPAGCYTDALMLPNYLIVSLSGAMSGLIAGITASMTSLKAAITTSWLPIVCVAAAAVAIVGIVYTVNKVVDLSSSAQRTISKVVAKVQAGGLDERKLRDNTVYVIVRNGTSDVIYVGRTNNFSARRNAHKKRFPTNKYTMLAIASNLTLSQARALEQTIITAYGIDTLKNMINSISPKKWSQFKSEFEQMQTLIESVFDPE